MINPKLRAKDRIYSELEPELKKKMEKSILSEEEHMEVLKKIMQESYMGKTPEKNPKFIIVAGQTGSGKSNLTSLLCQQDNNVVIIDSDKYKTYRKDSEKLLKEYFTEYAFLTAPDSYLHRDEMIVDAIGKRYNILLECAPTIKEGFFIDVEKLINRLDYDVEIDIMGVSSINSLLSVHERYEEKLLLNDNAAKLTNIARHDDSFEALDKAVRNVQNMKKVNIRIFERGRDYPYKPQMIFDSKEDKKVFSSPFHALKETQLKDARVIMPGFEKRYNLVKEYMENRKAPESQIKQLEQLKERSNILINYQDR